MYQVLRNGQPFLDPVKTRLEAMAIYNAALDWAGEIRIVKIKIKQDSQQRSELECV